MSTSRFRMSLAGLLLAAVSCASPEEPPPVKSVHYRGQVAMIQRTFTVEAVDADRRSVTLKSPEGATGTFIVGPEVKRFGEVKVGDTLVAQYHVGVFAEPRKPTPEEQATPIQIVQGASRAPTDVPPTGALTRTVKVVTTVDAVDRQAQTITLKGPLGNTLTFKPEEPMALGDAKPGQTLVVTFAEQLVLSLEAKK